MFGISLFVEGLIKFVFAKLAGFDNLKALETIKSFCKQLALKVHKLICGRPYVLRFAISIFG